MLYKITAPINSKNYKKVKKWMTPMMACQVGKSGGYSPFQLVEPGVIRSHSAIIIIITYITSKRLLRGKARDQFVLSLSFEVKSPRAFEKIENPPTCIMCLLFGHVRASRNLIWLNERSTALFIPFMNTIYIHCLHERLNLVDPLECALDWALKRSPSWSISPFVEGIRSCSFRA